MIRWYVAEFIIIKIYQGNINNMKKLAALVVSAVLLTSAFSSCGSKNDLLTYRYNYDLSEYIDLANYKGLPAEGYTINITDEDIQQQILATRSYYSKLTDITDRGAEYGDTLFIDYTGTMDGEIISEATESDAEVTIGAGSMPDEFENKLIGTKIGDTLSFDMTFPDPYIQYPDLSGDNVHFEVTVNNVCEQELPEYHDEFARAYLGYDTTAEYEEHIKGLMEDHYKQIYYQSIDEQIWNTILDNTTVKKYPEKELKQIYDDMVTSAEAYATNAGVQFASYVEAVYKMTEDEFYQDIQEQAEAYVKDEMVKYAIARAENITLTDEEYRKGAEEYATDVYGLNSVEELEAIYDKKTIRQTIMYEKVHEKVADYADVTLTNQNENAN